METTTKKIKNFLKRLFSCGEYIDIQTLQALNKRGIGVYY